MKEIFAQVLEVLDSNRYLAAAAIMAASLVLGLFLYLVVLNLLHRLAGKTKTDLDDKVIEAVRRPLLYTSLMLGGAMAARRIVEEVSGDEG